jgi:hypothetical protein
MPAQDAYLMIGGCVDGCHWYVNKGSPPQPRIHVLKVPKPLGVEVGGRLAVPDYSLDTPKDTYLCFEYQSGIGKYHLVYIFEDISPTQAFEMLLTNYRPPKLEEET